MTEPSITCNTTTVRILSKITDRIQLTLTNCFQINLHNAHLFTQNVYCGPLEQYSLRNDSKIYINKRPWKALPLPIKFCSLTPSFYGKLHIVQLCSYQIAAKSPFCFPSILLPRSIGSKHNPITLKHMDPLFLPRYHL